MGGAVLTTPPPRWKRPLLILARVLFLGGAFGLLGWQLAGDAAGARDAVRSIGVPAVLGAFLAAALGLGASGLAWRSLLGGVGAPLDLRGASRVFFTGQIGKYIPGVVWAYLAHARLGREHGVPASRTTAAPALFVIAHAATRAVVTALVLPFASAETFDRFWWVVAIAPLLLVLLHPRLVLPVLRRMHRILGRGSPPDAVLGSAVFAALGWLAITWLGYGVSMLLLLAPVVRADSEALLGPVALGGFALAWTVGFLAAGLLVVTPAGLGVREVVLFAVLGPVVAGGGAVAAVVLLSRVVHTLSDAAWALFGAGLRAPQPDAPGYPDDSHRIAS